MSQVALLSVANVLRVDAEVAYSFSATAEWLREDHASSLQQEAARKGRKGSSWLREGMPLEDRRRLTVHMPIQNKSGSSEACCF